MGWFDGLEQEYYGVEFVKDGKSVLFSSTDLLEIVQQFVKLQIDNLKFQDFYIIEPKNYFQLKSGYTPYNIKTWLALAEYIKQKECKDDIEISQIAINCGGRIINIFHPSNRYFDDDELGYERSVLSYNDLVQKIREANVSDERIIKMIKLLLIGHAPPAIPEALPYLVVALFGKEASTNPMSFIPTLMLLDLIESKIILSFNEVPVILEQENKYQLSKIIIEWLAQHQKNDNQQGIHLNRLSKSEFVKQQQQQKQLISPFYLECCSIVRNSISMLIEKFFNPIARVDILEEEDEKFLCKPCISKDDFLEILPFFEVQNASSANLEQEEIDELKRKPDEVINKKRPNF